MSDIYIERRHVADNRIGTIAHDVAHHIYSQQLKGRTIIVTREPLSFISMLRKHWLALVKIAQRERSRTLNPNLIEELTRQIAYIENLAFVAKSPGKMPTANIFLMSPEQLSTSLPSCNTIYVTCEVDDELRARLEGCLEKGGAFVGYG